MKTAFIIGTLCVLAIPLSFCTNKGIENNEPRPLIGYQIIADHTVVDEYDKIPQEYINKVKEMYLIVLGESHSLGYRDGLLLLEDINSSYDVNVSYTTPEVYSSSHLRFSRLAWGDYNNLTGWVSSYGEEDWWTTSTAISRTKAGISYNNETYGSQISAIGFAWCSDLTAGIYSTSYDPEFGCRWSGVTVNGPEGSRPWGLDGGDYSITGNSVNLDTYLSATQSYIDYCVEKGYQTKVFFTTGPVDDDSSWEGEDGYQGHLKHEKIRVYVESDSTRILFDYADILCYNDAGQASTTTWNGNTYPDIHPDNMGGDGTGHIGSVGAIRLGKAMWWMLARIAGWDGK